MRKLSHSLTVQTCILEQRVVLRRLFVFLTSWFGISTSSENSTYKMAQQCPTFYACCKSSTFEKHARVAGGFYVEEFGVWRFDSPVHVTGLTPVSPDRASAIKRLIACEEDSTDFTSILNESFRNRWSRDGSPIQGPAKCTECTIEAYADELDPKTRKCAWCTKIAKRK